MPNINHSKAYKTNKNLTDSQIVLFYKAITRYRRKSLIENRIAFVIQDGQMYLPFLGLDLKKPKNSLKKSKEIHNTYAGCVFVFLVS